MRRIAIINQKGGVGKTTTAACLSAALAHAGKKVLAVDLDPQAHLSLHFGVELTPDQMSIYDLLVASASIKDVAVRVNDHMTLVPADIDLAGAEAEMVSVPGREAILREAVNAVAGQYDAMLIDCPPSLGVLTINALVAADEVVIPLQAQFFALQGLSKLFETVTLVRQRINPALRVSGIVLCMHEAATRLAGEIVDDLAKFLDSARGTTAPWAEAQIYESRIRRNIKLAEASSYGQTVFDYAPRSNGAADYGALATEMFDVVVKLPEPANVRATPPAEPEKVKPNQARVPEAASKAEAPAKKKPTPKRSAAKPMAPAPSSTAPPTKASADAPPIVSASPPTSDAVSSQA